MFFAIGNIGISSIASLVDAASSCSRLMTEKGVCDEPEVTIRGQRSHDMLRPTGPIDVSEPPAQPHLQTAALT